MFYVVVLEKIEFVLEISMSGVYNVCDCIYIKGKFINRLNEPYTCLYDQGMR